MAVVDPLPPTVWMVAFLAVAAAPEEGVVRADDADALRNLMRNVLRGFGDVDELEGRDDMQRFVAEFLAEGLRAGVLLAAQAEPMRALLWDRFNGMEAEDRAKSKGA
jgi:hypothetical protein